MSNPFDIRAYIAKNKERGMAVSGTELEYAQKVGMYLYGKQKFPGMTGLEAYMLVVNNVEPITDLPAVPQVPSNPGGGCSGCGGGQLK